MKTKTRRNRKNKKLYKGGEEKRVVIDLSETINLFVDKLSKLFEKNFNEGGIQQRVDSLKADFQQQAEQQAALAADQFQKQATNAAMENVRNSMNPNAIANMVANKGYMPATAAPAAGGSLKKTRRLKKTNKRRKKK